MAKAITRRTGFGLFLRYWLPVTAYVSLIFFLSAQPYLQPPLHFQNSDKLMHFGEYGLLGLLLGRALHASLTGHDLVFASLLALAIGMAIAALDERFQAFIPGRDCSLFDWFADSTGGTFAQLVFLAFAREWRDG